MGYSQHINWDCAHQAAQVVLPQLIEANDVMSVVDFGCGMGAWLTVAAEQGAVRLVGLDSDPDAWAPVYIDADITQQIDLGERFDLAICVEVAEHLPASAAEVLVDTICRHSTLILFSAATPGQGGDGHINEQPHAYWDDRFTARGYRMERVATNGSMASWYRDNLRVFRC